MDEFERRSKLMARRGYYRLVQNGTGKVLGLFPSKWLAVAAKRRTPETSIERVWGN